MRVERLCSCVNSSRVTAHEQLRTLADGTASVVGDALVGVYAHGSLALGCFNPRRSDLDVLVVVERSPTFEERAELAALFSRVSGPAGSLSPEQPVGLRPLELHVVRTDELRPWRHPAPFELHWRGELVNRGVDRDLAAHVTVVRAAGIAVVGSPPRSVFPPVPRGDYEDALRGDLAWTREHGRELYAVLSPLRVWASLTTGQLHSKATAARWAVPRLPSVLRPLAERALASYEGDGGAFEHDPRELERLLDFVEAQLDAA